MRKQLVTGKKLLLFIDTGDNCRCPLASGYLHKLLDQKNIKYIDIKTAGVMTPTGLLPTPEVVQLLAEEGVDIKRHRSRPLTIELIRQADLILGMTPIHVQKAIRMTDDARGKTFLIKEYVGNTGRNVQIPDPMGGTLEIFKKCFSDIRQALQKLVDMDFVAKPPEAREMVVVDTTPVVTRQPQPGETIETAPKTKVKPKPVAPLNKPMVLPSARKSAAPKPAPRPVAAAKKPAPAAKAVKPAAKPSSSKAAAKPAKSAKPVKPVKASKPAKPAKAAPARKAR